MKILTLFAFTLTSLIANAHAQDATLKGGLCVATSFTGTDAKFNCEHLGRSTIKEIYDKGWRVVSITQPKEPGNWTYLVIEKQR